jgi:predicted aspartyl protease
MVNEFILQRYRIDCHAGNSVYRFSVGRIKTVFDGRNYTTAVRTLNCKTDSVLGASFAEAHFILKNRQEATNGTNTN